MAIGRNRWRSTIVARAVSTLSCQEPQGSELIINTPRIYPVSFVK